jgi:hypothetical protein
VQLWNLQTTANVDSGRGEGLPTRLTDVGGNKQVDAGSKTIAFLKEFVEEDDDEGGDDELNDEEKASTSTEVAWLPI